MSKATVVQYQARPEAVEHHQRLIQQVFEELNTQDPGGFGYTVLRLADGFGFVHVAVFDGTANPLGESSAFQTFQCGIETRLTAPPVATPASVVGSYPHR
ncbi:MAG: hypothetical protein QOE41_1953 [Mycobacterium sp.]|jgi:hypothetical protein|nr:hypothetical protein [Mycobacterium sp.]MDT5132642.1 hypothetical protein [Mycobacterium sp.]